MLAVYRGRRELKSAFARLSAGAKALFAVSLIGRCAYGKKQTKIRIALKNKKPIDRHKLLLYIMQ
jgi:hypothetical protein